ncbi:MAG TPA: HAD family hydrolase [Candidatus Limnocylindrales bacterium]|nr:HAD family hydrolase [Candidatus Limnocylindrales bacterium]
MSPSGPAGPIDFSGIELVVFDKDGTLIDFDVMWGGWAESLADRLEASLAQPIRSDLHQRIGYDTKLRRTRPGSPLAATPMADLRRMTTDVVVRSTGRSPAAAAGLVDDAWLPPDPVLLAHPLADLAALFGSLRAKGCRIAVVTSDDRAPTEATLQALGVDGFVEALVCADDGLPSKPAPDTILAACRTLGVAVGRTAMIGDSVADMTMATAAGVELRVAVLSGIGRRSELEPLADVVLDSIAGLLPA